MKRSILKNEESQMLLLTGISVIIIIVAAASYAANSANINVQISVEDSQDITSEYEMIKEKYLRFLESQINYGDSSTVDEAINETESVISLIESKYNLHFFVDYKTPNPNIELTLQNDNTIIKEIVDISYLI